MGLEILWDEKSCGKRNLVGQKIMWNKKSCGTRNLVGQKILWNKKSCDTRNVVGHEILWDKKILWDFGTRNLRIKTEHLQVYNIDTPMFLHTWKISIQSYSIQIPAKSNSLYSISCTNLCGYELT